MSAAAPARGSSLAALRVPRFLATSCSFLGAQMVVWGATVGAVEVLTAAAASPALIASIQTAVGLPAMALALVAGAIADIVARRRLLLGATLVMLSATVTLAALTMADAASPLLVLALVLVLGTGLALFLPAFAAAVPDLVPRRLVSPAVALGGVTSNVARAVGPAFAGLVLAVSGAPALFWALAAVLALVVVLLGVAGPTTPAPAQPERIGAAVRAGWRYARHSAPVRRTVARTWLFVLSATVLWALLPLIAVHNLGLDASGFGLVLSCVGAGAIVAALGLQRVNERFADDPVVTWSGVALALVLILLTLVAEPALAAVLLLVAGAAWMTACMTLMISVQFAVPDWVRARALAVWLLAYQGGMALGSLAWGAVAEVSLTAGLLIPAGVLLASALAPKVIPLPAARDASLEPARTWADPVVAEPLDDHAGPVLITVEYEVAPEDAEEFTAAMEELGARRRRDGAKRWDLYVDVAAPDRFFETFTVATWGEHLRQHERWTQADLPAEERVVALVRDYTARHLVGARSHLMTQAASPGSRA